MGQQGGLDIKKLRALQKDINKKAGKGDGLMLYSNKLGEEVNIRILPPPDHANGVYYVEQEVWWINKKTYLSNSTEILGGVDVIEEEIENARATKDKELIALLDKKNNNMPVIKKEYRYLIPILLLETKYDDDDQLVSCEVADYKILVAKPTLLRSINGVVTARPYQNKTKYGIADRAKGYNLIIGKTGKGIDTEYTAIGWNEPMEMDEKWYDESKMPDVHKLTHKGAKSDEYLRSVIRNYLYGEEILEDTQSEETDTKEETKTDAKKSSRPTRPKKAEKPKEQPKETSRNLLDDAEDGMDDELDDL